MIFKLHNSSPKKGIYEKRDLRLRFARASVGINITSAPFCSEKCSGLGDKFYGHLLVEYLQF